VRRGLRVALVLLVAALALRLAWLHETRSHRRDAGASPLTLVVAPGASAEAIGRQLRELGLVRHPLVFRLLVRERGFQGRLKAGEYALDGPLSLDQIADMLARGDVVRREITIPEGRSILEIAEIVGAQGMSAEEFWVLARDPGPIRDLDPVAEDLEGYLFPDTYEVPRVPEAARALLVRMVRRFRDVIATEKERLEVRGLRVREVVTLASVVELETARAEERPRIAAVFWNRLKRGMPLQADPTVIYALRRAGRWDGNIRRKDLDIDSPYNTYRRSGLPPGPIGSPGREAIRAVLEPADTRDLYFVSRNDGSHHFSESLVEHNRAVDRYQRRRSRS